MHHIQGTAGNRDAESMLYPCTSECALNSCNHAELILLSSLPFLSAISGALSINGTDNIVYNIRPGMGKIFICSTISIAIYGGWLSDIIFRQCSGITSPSERGELFAFTAPVLTYTAVNSFRIIFEAGRALNTIRDFGPFMQLQLSLIVLGKITSGVAMPIAMAAVFAISAAAISSGVFVAPISAVTVSILAQYAITNFFANQRVHNQQELAQEYR